MMFGMYDFFTCVGMMFALLSFLLIFINSYEITRIRDILDRKDMF